jgi:hypothetical protein
MVAVYLFSFIGSGSHIVIIPLTDDSCVYMFSFTGSGYHIVIIPSPSIDASYQVSVHLAEGFQRRRLKCEKLTDDGQQTTDAK